MTEDALYDVMRQGLWVAVTISAPLLTVALVAGVGVVVPWGLVMAAPCRDLGTTRRLSRPAGGSGDRHMGQAMPQSLRVCAPTPKTIKQGTECLA